MHTPLYTIPIEAKGRLALMPRPRGGDWLEDELSNWRRQGVSQVVSALASTEITELSLDSEESLCTEVGIQYRSFPIQDRSVPDDPSAFVSFLSETNIAVAEGAFVAVHCRMGIGRSGVIVASLLVLRGLAVTDAFDVISQARGLRVPDTPEQVEWVRQNIRQGVSPGHGNLPK